MKTGIIYHGSQEIVQYPIIKIAKYHKDFYYQSRDYIFECYQQGQLI